MKRTEQYIDSNAKSPLTPLGQRGEIRGAKFSFPPESDLPLAEITLLQRGKKETDAESPLYPPLKKGGRGDLGGRKGKRIGRQLCFLTAAFICAMTSTALAATVSYLTITAKEVIEETRQLEEGIQAALGGAAVKEVAYPSEEAEKWIKRLQIRFLPYVIFTEGIEKHEQFFELARKGMLERRQGRWYVIPDEVLKQTGRMLLERERKPGQLDVFVMSQCPAARPVVAQLANYIKTAPDKIRLTLHYLTTFQEFGIDSLHGPEEIREDLRQIILQREYPREFIAYLLLLNEKPPKEALKELGISLEYLDSQRQEALEILRQDFELAREMDIKQSPMILWENVYLVPGVEGLKNHTPFKKEKSLAALKPAASAKIPVDFFFSYGCRSCLWVKDVFLPVLAAEYKNEIILNYHDVSVPDELALKLSLEKECGILGGSIPLIFLPGNIALEGKTAISKKLEPALRGLLGRDIYIETKRTGQYIDSNAKSPLTPLGQRGEMESTEKSSMAKSPLIPLLQRGKKETDAESPLYPPLKKGGRGDLSEGKTAAGKKTIIENFFSFSPAVISLAGFLDGLNPCAFATMVFFVSFLSMNNFRKNRIIYIGGAFIAGVFLTYLGLGVGIFEVFKKMQLYVFLSRLIYYGIALLTLSLGIYGMYDYLRYKKTGFTKGCSLNMYNRLRRLGDHRRGIIILTIAAFLNGFIIALLESACTGQVYFPTIAFVMHIPRLRAHAAAYLLLYNVLFILPLIIIFILAHKGIGSEKVALWTTKHQGAVKLASALLFFGLSAFLFLFA